MNIDNMHTEITLDGFESIFKQHYSPLFRYVNSLVKDDDCAKDVLSDLFLTLWQQKDSLQINNINAYLFRCARNGALKAINLKSGTIALPDNAFEIPADAYNPFEKFVSKQSIQIVKDLISKLPALRREIIELRLLGLKNYEIAEALEISEKKVEYNMREAIEQLGKYIKNGNLDKAALVGSAMLVQLIVNFI